MTSVVLPPAPPTSRCTVCPSITYVEPTASVVPAITTEEPATAVTGPMPPAETKSVVRATASVGAVGRAMVLVPPSTRTEDPALLVASATAVPEMVSVCPRVSVEPATTIDDAPAVAVMAPMAPMPEVMVVTGTRSTPVPAPVAGGPVGSAIVLDPPITRTEEPALLVANATAVPEMVSVWPRLSVEPAITIELAPAVAVMAPMAPMLGFIVVTGTRPTPVAGGAVGRTSVLAEAPVPTISTGAPDEDAGGAIPTTVPPTVAVLPTATVTGGPFACVRTTLLAPAAMLTVWPAMVATVPAAAWVTVGCAAAGVSCIVVAGGWFAAEGETGATTSAVPDEPRERTEEPTVTGALPGASVWEEMTIAPLELAVSV